MPLKRRLIWSMTVALLVGLLLACGITILQARQAVKREVASEFAVGRQALDASLRELRLSEASESDLRRVIGIFDGDRNIRASLIGERGVVVTTSVPAPTGWFRSRL